MADPLDRLRFEMLGARTAIASGLAHIQRQVSALEDAIWKQPALAFDLAKALVESVCKIILDEREVEYSKADDLPKLYRSVSTILPLLPPNASAESKARESLKKAMGGLSTSLIGICELRNSLGFTSHGSSVIHADMESTQALLAAQSADAIIGFLYSNHIRERKINSARPAQYGDHGEFDEYIDSSFPTVNIFDLEYQPSEVLFYVDRDAYMERMQGFSSEDAVVSDEDNAVVQGTE